MRLDGDLRRLGLEVVGDGEGPVNFWKRMPKFLGSEFQLRVQPFIFDATGGKAIAAHSLVDDAGKAVIIPDDSILLFAIYDVTTTFTSANDTGTIALHANSANDIVSAVAINDGGNPWDAGIHATIQVLSAATMVKMTADRTLTATVAVQALTAGVLRGYAFSLVPHNYNPYA